MSAAELFAQCFVARFASEAGQVDATTPVRSALNAVALELLERRL